MTNIILCGGTRLWPISRILTPKQFVKFFDSKSLFELIVERNTKICTNSMIVSNEGQYFLILDQLEENLTFNMQNSRFFLEPIGRNTTLAIAFACMTLDKEEMVLVTPFNHLIKNEKGYEKVLLQAKKFANEDNLITFVITSTFAETGVGYIEANSFDAKAFHEKPNTDTAKKYLEAGNYYLNSDRFIFKTGVFLQELQKYAPEIYEACLTAFKHASNEDMMRIKYEDMLAISEDSIDYPIMEKLNKFKIILNDIDWSDVGSFDALYEELEQDENGNTKNDKHISIGSKKNLIYTQDKYIATFDVEDLIIVDTRDALFVSKKGSSQKVKKVVAEIKEYTELHNIHLIGYRSWGSYTILEDTQGYKIKRIEVKTSKRLSLQKHFHRNEHWIVVSGTATVTVGDKKYLVRLNESTYIKMGEVHRLENKGKIPVILIEAQVGEYTGEDDIIRIDNDFKRINND